MTLNGQLIHSKLTMGHGKCQSDEEVCSAVLPLLCRVRSPASRVRILSATSHARRAVCLACRARATQLDNIIDKVNAVVK